MKQEEEKILSSFLFGVVGGSCMTLNDDFSDSSGSSHEGMLV